MTTRSIASLLSIGSSTRRKLSPEEAIKKALRGDIVQKSLPPVKNITAHFRLLKSDKALPKVKLSWLDNKGNAIKTHGPVRTNDKGWGMLCIEDTAIRGLPSLSLVVTFNDMTTTFHDIKPDALREKTSIPGQEGFAVAFDPAGPSLDIPPKKKRPRRFTVAVSGRPEHLKTAIPLLKGRACIQLKEVFIDGKTDKEILSLCKGVKVAKADKGMPGLLEGIDCLIDLSDLSLIRKLAQAQVAGTGILKTIIIPDAARFLGREDRLLSYYERPGHPVSELAEVLSQVSKKSRIGGR